MSEENSDQFTNVQFAEQAEISLERIPTEGYLLDIGGGGEGIIGQLEGTRVVAIDKRKDELQEASVGNYLRIVMDASNLQFLDASFPTVTAFFSMMYMPLDIQKKVFEEISRVLTPEGEFWLWDLNIPKQYDTNKQVYAIALSIHLPEGEIGTGYGCPWEGREQDASHFKKLGEEVGLEITEELIEEHKFFLKFQKP